MTIGPLAMGGHPDEVRAPEDWLTEVERSARRASGSSTTATASSPPTSSYGCAPPPCSTPTRPG
ncbi:hypothetical protein ACFQYP_29190 [Nonomuraea antimicrobica]